MAREDAHFRLRLPQDMHDRLTALAREHGRSINAEIIARIERTFQSDEWKPPATQEQLQEIGLKMADGINRRLDELMVKFGLDKD